MRLLDQNVREVPSSIKDSDNHDLILCDLENNGCAPFKTHRPQSRSDVITARPTSRKARQGGAWRFDPINEFSGNSGARLFGNIFIECEQVGFGMRPKNDSKFHPTRPLSVAHDVRADA
jgi:hypothetical protein